MMQQHAGTTIAHDPENLLLLWAGIAMDRTHTAERLYSHTRAPSNPGYRIGSNRLTVRTQLSARKHHMVMTPAIKLDNLADRCLFPLSFLLDIHDMPP